MQVRWKLVNLPKWRFFCTKELIMSFYASFPFNFDRCVGYNDAVLTRQCMTSELSQSFSVF